MIVKLLAKHHLEFLSLKGGCRGWSEATLVKMSNCWKSHVTAHISFESTSDHSLKTSRLFAPLTLCILDSPKRVNSDDPDVMQHNAALHQGLHCLLN